MSFWDISKQWEYVNLKPKQWWCFPVSGAPLELTVRLLADRRLLPWEKSPPVVWSFLSTNKDKHNSCNIIITEFKFYIFFAHLEHAEKKKHNTPPVNVPVIPQSQQCFNLLRHLMSHLNVLQPSNMNHEYLHPGVGQHSLLEYITPVPGDHFVHPSKMYHISTVREGDMTSCVLWCKYYYNSWNSNTYGRAINLNHKPLGRDLQWS